MKVALITGITGQDGSYLSELLLEKDYYVWGIIRRASDINTKRINHLYSNKKLILRYGDMTDAANLLMILSEIKNTYGNMERLEVYNLAAMSHVKVSFEMPIYTGQADGIGVLNLLEAIRSNGLIDKTRFYQAFINFTRFDKAFMGSGLILLGFYGFRVDFIRFLWILGQF